MRNMLLFPCIPSKQKSMQDLTTLPFTVHVGWVPKTGRCSISVNPREEDTETAHRRSPEDREASRIQEVERIHEEASHFLLILFPLAAFRIFCSTYPWICPFPAAFLLLPRFPSPPHLFSLPLFIPLPRSCCRSLLFS